VTDDLAFAHGLADRADEITAARFHSRDFSVRQKPDGSDVTDVDVQVEEALRKVVAEARPRDGFLGEETGLHARGASRSWIVDGIDGTRAFVAGGPTWGTLVALQDRGDIVVGIASSPGLATRWWAARGRGAWTAELGSPSRGPARRLAVSHQRSFDAARAVVLPPAGALDGWRRESALRVASSLLPSTTPGHGPLLVAAGDIEASVILAGGPWDHAPFVVIVEEAGGRYSDLWGGRRIDTATAVFTNGPLHDDLRRLAAAGAPLDPRAQ